MEPSKTVSSFIQYQRCSLCRVNHNKGWKHVYSKKHAETVDNVMIKLAAKIEKAYDELKNPAFHMMMSNITPSNFWCYFCASEAPKEMQLSDLRVSSLGIIEHIASMDHKKKTLAFWNDNHISKSRMQPFISLDDDFQKLKGRLEEQAVAYLHEQRQSLAEAAKKFELETRQRTRLVAVCREMANSSSSGNVHSSALPPWMQEDDDDVAAEATDNPIGPTADDFAKHLANQKKRKLPSMRVGAKFDRKGSFGETWLPSFGRVWSKNRRLHGQNSFTRAMKFNRKQSSFSETTTSSNDSKRFKHTDRPFSTNSVTSGFGGANGTFEHKRNYFCSASTTGASHTLPGAYKSKRKNCSTISSNGNQQINIAPNLL